MISPNAARSPTPTIDAVQMRLQRVVLSVVCKSTQTGTLVRRIALRPFQTRVDELVVHLKRSTDEDPATGTPVAVPVVEECCTKLYPAAGGGGSSVGSGGGGIYGVRKLGGAWGGSRRWVGTGQVQRAAYTCPRLMNSDCLAAISPRNRDACSHHHSRPRVVLFRKEWRNPACSGGFIRQATVALPERVVVPRNQLDC